MRPEPEQAAQRRSSTEPVPFQMHSERCLESFDMPVVPQSLDQCFGDLAGRLSHTLDYRCYETSADHGGIGKDSRD